MFYRHAAVLLFAGGCLWGEGTTPKPAASDYPRRATISKISIGAEYLARSLPVRGQTFSLPEHLVVEVAVYGAAGEPAAVSNSQFTLRLRDQKGKKQILHPQLPSFVAASLKYPDWERRPTVVAGAGVGEAGVIIGRPEMRERFPGDPRPGQSRLPAPPRAPEPEDRGGLGGKEQVRAEEAVLELALREGPVSRPASGYLYFPFKGKTKSIRGAELEYAGPAGTASLPLF